MSLPREHIVPKPGRTYTKDTFVNFAAQLGYGSSNVMGQGTYGFNPITRNRTLLEWAYRGSWVVGMGVDLVAEDMTREGIDIITGMPSEQIEQMQAALQMLDVWGGISDAVKWSRLYGGALGVIMIDGQDPSVPLRPETIREGQFKGVYAVDRWMTEPQLTDLIGEEGPDMGLPRSYRLISTSPIYPMEYVHYTRVVRLEGVKLPFYQRQTEWLWGISVLERLYDRLIAFDSTTVGAAQLIFKAHLRTLSIEKLRELIAFGGEALAAVKAQVDFIRLFQSNEGITLLDASDKFETHQYAFSGLSDMMLQFGQQLAGALGIPLVRLFGQSPAGLNSTGESDFRNYYDGINAKQENQLRRPMKLILDVLCRSQLGIPLPPDFQFQFKSLWQMSAIEKGELAAAVTDSVNSAYENGLVEKATALEELRTSSRITGIWTNITDEEIAAARLAPPMPPGGMPESRGNGAGNDFPQLSSETNTAEEPGLADDEVPQLTYDPDEVTEEDYDEGDEGPVLAEIDIEIEGGGEVTVR